MFVKKRYNSFIETFTEIKQFYFSACIDSVSFTGVSGGDQTSFGLEQERFERLPGSSDDEESNGGVQ